MTAQVLQANVQSRWWLAGVVVSGLLGLAFVYVFVANAWVVDDAYITFRTVDNFVNGRGLTWNPGERVQVFTHPLWMLVMSAAYAVTGDVFYTSVIVSFAACVGAIVLGYRLLDGWHAPWRLAALLGLLLSCKAFMDYTSSGLENALSYLLSAAFCWQALATAEPATISPERQRGLWFTASLAFVNRHDSLLLYLPVLALLLWQRRRSAAWSTARLVALATLPALAWLFFATLYFGFPLPNTYYAKASTGLVPADRLQRGLEYFANSIAWDSASHVAVLAALGLAVWHRHRVAQLLLAGVGAYYAFILWNACTTHMSGRFFALPLFVALLLLARMLPTPRAAAGLLVVLVCYNAWNPLAPWKMGLRWYHPGRDDGSRIDANYLVHVYGPRVLNPLADRDPPDHEWYHLGEQLRRSAVKVHVGGPGHIEAIGYFGFAAGPEKVIVDYVGLADPLLSHLPACNVDTPERWKSGHFYRLPPEGYLASLERGENLIKDSDLHQYYDQLLLVVRGQHLLSWSRLKAIAGLNLGGYRHWITSYAERERAALRAADCRKVLWLRIRTGQGL